jgi:hypothetical protein
VGNVHARGPDLCANLVTIHLPVNSRQGAGGQRIKITHVMLHVLGGLFLAKSNVESFLLSFSAVYICWGRIRTDDIWALKIHPSQLPCSPPWRVSHSPFQRKEAFFWSYPVRFIFLLLLETFTIHHGFTSSWKN